MMVASDLCQELGIGGAISLLWFRLAVHGSGTLCTTQLRYQSTTGDMPHSSVNRFSSRDLGLMHPGAML